MSRALISIGVNNYDFASDLAGAEIDAQLIYDELTKPDVGFYDTSKSRLLLSPSLERVRATVAETILDGSQLDELTFYFAGHGMIQPVGFYMAVRDTRCDRATATAYSLSELFANLSESMPKQTNIILDACFSGGLAADLSILTRPEKSGYVGSPAVTLLAMSARNQVAGEFPSGGIGTTALYDCIVGRTLVREDLATLDLYDIGQIVIQRVSSDASQNPVISALNVHRSSSFCRNPLFQASARSALKNWDARAFLEAIEPVLASHADAPLEIIADIERLFKHMIDKADSSNDLFKGVELRATAAVALLQYAEIHPEIQSHLLERFVDISNTIRKTLHLTVENLRSSKYELLMGPGSLSNLFYLPIRISKIIGWAGALFYLEKVGGQLDHDYRKNFAALLQVLLDNYRLSFSAISDVQAPYLAVGLTVAHIVGLHEEGCEILSSMFNSFLECQANVADAHIKPSKVLDYLIARSERSFDQVPELVAQPTELGTILLTASALFDLSPIFDEAMEDLDHKNINAFIASDYSQFGLKKIPEGENNTFAIGHDIWNVEDLLKNVPDQSSILPPNEILACGAIMSALVFPDRVPWFVFPTPFEIDNQLQDNSAS